MRPRGFVALSLAFAVLVAALVDGGPIEAAVLTKIPVGRYPTSIAINVATDRVFVVNHDDWTLSVIAASTGQVLATRPAGWLPFGVAVDPAGSRVYITEETDQVIVLDGTSYEQVAQIPVGDSPRGLALVPATSKLYVANNASSSVSVIDTTSNRVIATIPINGRPVDVEANATTNRLYVASPSSNSTSVIDGATDRVIATIPSDCCPVDVAVNPVTNRVYIANMSSGTVSVVDGANNAVLRVLTILGDCCIQAVVVDPDTNGVFTVANSRFYAIDGATSAIYSTEVFPLHTQAMAIHPQTHRVYVNEYTDRVANVWVMEQDWSAPESTAWLDRDAQGAKLSITCVDAWTGCLRSEYALDGGAFVPWTGPTLMPAGSHTVDVRSIDRSGKIEAPFRLTIGTDVTPPQTTISSTSAGATGQWTAGTWAVSLTCADPGGAGCQQMQYAVDGAAVKRYAAPFTVEAEGLHVVRFGSIDLAGNRATLATATLGVDRTGPAGSASATATAPIIDGWTSGSWTFSLSCADPPAGAPAGASGCKPVRYSVDGGSERSYTAQFQISDEGYHAVWYQATDVAGNQDAARTQYGGVDRTPPTAQMRTTNNTVFVPVARPAELRASVDDGNGSGVSRLCFDISRIDLVSEARTSMGCMPASWDGSAWSARPNLSTAKYEIRARPTDVVGLSSMSPPVVVYAV